MCKQARGCSYKHEHKRDEQHGPLGAPANGALALGYGFVGDIRIGARDEFRGCDIRVIEAWVVRGW